MKKALILMVLLLIPIVSADISLNPALKERYNIGDEVQLEGYILMNSEFNGNFNIVLICNDNTDTIMTKVINLKPLEKKSFSELGTDKITLKSSHLGTCKIKALLGEESAESKSFTVVKDLEASFKVQETKLQLGQFLMVQGLVFKLDGKNLEGNGDFSLTKDNKLSLGNVQVKNGEISFSSQLKNLAKGAYDLEARIYDGIGNEKTFKLPGIELDDNIEFQFVTDKIEYAPNDIIHLSGNVISKIGNTKAAATIEQIRKESSVDDGKFFLNLTLPSDISAGKHTINVLLTDEFGNSGIMVQDINIIQVVRKIETLLEKKVVMPGDDINAKALLSDQTGKDMQGDVTIRVFTPNNEAIGTKIEKTNTIASFTLNKYSAPGEYFVEATHDALKDTATFVVPEVKKIETEIIGQSVKVTNLGNIKYTDPIYVSLTNQDSNYDMTLKVDLEPGNSENLDIGNNVATGAYEVVLSYDNKSKIFQNMKIEDNRPFLVKTSDQITGYTTMDPANSILFDLPFFAFVLLLITGLFVYFKRTKTKDEIISEIKHDDIDPYNREENKKINNP